MHCDLKPEEDMEPVNSCLRRVCVSARMCAVVSTRACVHVPCCSALPRLPSRHNPCAHLLSALIGASTTFSTMEPSMPPLPPINPIKGFREPQSNASSPCLFVPLVWVSCGLVWLSLVASMDCRRSYVGAVVAMQGPAPPLPPLLPDFLTTSCLANPLQKLAALLSLLASLPPYPSPMPNPPHCARPRTPDSPIKIIDFSLASFFHTSTEPGGTPEFVAPELLIKPEYYAENGCDPSLDCWALGIIMFYLLCGTVGGWVCAGVRVCTCMPLLTCKRLPVPLQWTPASSAGSCPGLWTCTDVLTDTHTHACARHF